MNTNGRSHSKYRLPGRAKAYLPRVHHPAYSSYHAPRHPRLDFSSSTISSFSFPPLPGQIRWQKSGVNIFQNIDARFLHVSGMGHDLAITRELPRLGPLRWPNSGVNSFKHVDARFCMSGKLARTSRLQESGLVQARFAGQNQASIFAKY